MISNWTNRVAATVRSIASSAALKDEADPSSPVRLYKAKSFGSHPAYRFIERHKMLGRTFGVENPFFKTQEKRVGATGVVIGGKQYLNYSYCDYLGLSTHPEVIRASHAAIDEFGSCVSASRMVGGQLRMHQELETEVAQFVGLESALLFVSGHAANVSTIGTVVGKNDLIITDEFVHNSAVVGVRLSGATHRNYPHNDLAALEKILSEERGKYENVLVVVEGLYSTEGDIVDLARVVEIKERYGAWLMVDDAHGLGVLGKTGRGIAEHSGVDPRRIDILMGTLSKTLASCGGYIAGSAELIEMLKYTAPGFVYSVGLIPSNTAAALASLRAIKAEPERVARLQANSQMFKRYLDGAGLDTGISAGYGMIPVIVGSVPRTGKVSRAMLDAGFSVNGIIYPGVPINAGRLRFFVTSEHTDADIPRPAATVKEKMSRFW